MPTGGGQTRARLAALFRFGVVISCGCGVGAFLGPPLRCAQLVLRSSAASGAQGKTAQGVLWSSSVLEAPRAESTENGKRANVTTGRFILLEGLPFEASESDVRTFLADPGVSISVKSLDIPMAPPEKGPRPGTCKGMAVAELASEEEAARAVGLKGKEILGRWISVDRCLDPAETTTVKVRGVPFSASTTDLAEFFKQFGEVDGATISHERNGIAYVTFKDNASAVKALAQDGCRMGNRWLDIALYLRPFLHHKRPVAETAEASSRPSYRAKVTGLPYEATVADLRAALSSMGVEALNIFVPQFRGNSSRNTGVAYLTMRDEAELLQALDVGNITVGSRYAVITKALPRRPVGEEGSTPVPFERKSRRPATPNTRMNEVWENRVFMGNLPWETSPEAIKMFFEANGVSGVDKVAQPKAKPGTAYVSFATPEDAAKAVALNGQAMEHGGRSRLVRINEMQSSARGDSQAYAGDAEGQY